MKILLIEDETPAATRMTQLLSEYDPSIEVLGVLDTVEASIHWLKTHPRPDLIFVDIQLADGLSFEIFETMEVDTPIIFTTAYDQYALQAFRVHSIDYLLKPIDPVELARAMRKYEKFQPATPLPNWQVLQQEMIPPRARQRFLIKVGEQFRSVSVEEITYFMAESKLVMLVNQQQRSWPIDHTLDELEGMLDGEHFFRLNRKFLVRLSAIKGIHTYFNHRLKIELNPPPDQDVIVSRERAPLFKAWLDR